MEFENQFSQMAALLGDKVRSVMLWNLLDGRAYTATELSLCADVSCQSASNHLAKLVEAHLLTVEKQGKHRYFRLANAEVAQVVESMASLVQIPSEQRKERPTPNGVTYARTCYDHLAGRAGVEITAALIRQGILRAVEKKYEVSACGYGWFRSLGIRVEEIKCQKRSFAHPCLDWSERRHHVAGALGASLLRMMLQEDWIRRVKNSRQIWITPKGQTELKERLHLEV